MANKRPFVFPEPPSLESVLLGLFRSVGAGRPADELSGPSVVTVPEVSGSGVGQVVDLGRVESELDAEALPGFLPAELVPAEFRVDVAEPQLGAQLARALPAPLVAFGDGRPVTIAEALLATPAVLPGLYVDDSLTAGDVADFLDVLAHADRGFVARAANLQAAQAILNATTAALRGDDIRAAYREPAPLWNSIRPQGAAAYREVLLGIEIDDPGIADALGDLRA